STRRSPEWSILSDCWTPTYSTQNTPGRRRPRRLNGQRRLDALQNVNRETKARWPSPPRQRRSIDVQRRSDKLQRFCVDPAFLRKGSAPLCRRYIACDVPTGRFAPIKELAQRCARRRRCPAFQQSSRHRALAPPVAYHRIVNRCVPAESFRIDVRPRVDVRAMREKQLEELLLIEIERQVQQRCSINRCPMHSGTSILRATQFRRINLQATEPALEQRGFTAQKLLQPCHVAAMKCHHRCVGQRVTLPRENLQHRVLSLWIPS